MVAATVGYLRLRPAPPPPVPEVPPVAAGTARVALVIDDLGRSVADVETFEDLGAPLTYAVLPFEDSTREVVAELRRRGAEIVLHLPMQGQGKVGPGRGALTAAMSEAELVAATRAALVAVPGATGVNNHMGSALTADEPTMRTVLGVVAAEHLFFVDSRTSAATVAYRVAADLEIPVAERQVFLDDDLRPGAIRFEFARLLNLARERGSAVAIGHPHPATLAVLRQEIPRARALGYQLVRVSVLLHHGSRLRTNFEEHRQ